MKQRISIIEVFRLAFPSIISMVSITIQNFIDTAFISHIGKAEVAAVGLVTWYIWTILSFFRGITSITNTFVARYFGGRRFSSIGIIAWHFIYLAILSGVIYYIIGLFTPIILRIINPPSEVLPIAIEYTKIRFLEAFFIVILFVLDDFFKGIKRPEISMFIIALISILNIFLDYTLIFGNFGFPRLEVKGAAIATVISEFIGFAIFFYIFLSGKSTKNYKTTLIPHISIKIIKKIFKIGIPAGLQNVLDVASFLIFSIIITKMGTEAMAINQIVIQILSLTFMPGLGFSRAATTLCSSYIGENKINLARKSVHLSNIVALSIMMPVAVTFILIPEAYLKIFTSDPSLISAGKKILLISAIYEAFDAIGLVYSGGLMGAGDTGFIMWTILLSAWGLFLPFTYIFGILMGWGIIGAWVSMALYIFVFGIAVLIRFNSKKWENIIF